MSNDQDWFVGAVSAFPPTAATSSIGSLVATSLLPLRSSSLRSLERGGRCCHRGQRAPDPGRARHADGRAAAPLLDAGAAGQRGARAGQRSGARAVAGRGPRRVPRHERPGRPGRRRTARTAARRCSSDATRSAGCAAPTTAGSSTPTARASTCRPSRRRAYFKNKVRVKAYPTHESGGIVWTYMGPAGDDDALPRLRHRGARARAASPPRSCTPTATGCRRWRATSTPRTSPGCTSSTASTTSPTTAATSPATRPTRCRGSSGATTARRAWRSRTPGTASSTPACGRRPTATPTCG